MDVETQEMIGMFVGLLCLVPAALTGVVGFLTGLMDAAPDSFDRSAEWEQNVRRMYREYQLGNDTKIRHIRDNMGYLPPGHKPSDEADRMLREMGKFSGY